MVPTEAPSLFQIYDEMEERNITWLLNHSPISDPLLLTPKDDDRTCVALVAGNEVQLLDTEQIFMLSRSLNGKWISPKIHSTFIILRGWSTGEKQQEDWSGLEQVIRDCVPSYEICFNRAIPVKTGLLLCGIPYLHEKTSQGHTSPGSRGENNFTEESNFTEHNDAKRDGEHNRIFDINTVREKIREMGYETNVLYKCDIVHTTLLRWSENITEEEKLGWLQRVVTLPRKPYARVLVDRLDVVVASWTMKSGTTKVVHSIRLQG